MVKQLEKVQMTAAKKVLLIGCSSTASNIVSRAALGTCRVGDQLKNGLDLIVDYFGCFWLDQSCDDLIIINWS